MMRSIFIAASAALLLFPRVLLAQGTKLWLESHYDDFEKGQPQNVAITSDGYLESGPELHSILVTPSSYLWAVASDSQGNAYLATGSPATVLKVAPDGKSSKLFSTKDLSVQAVAVARDGTVYAATLPSGKVYRIPAGQSNLDDTTATVAFDPAALASSPNSSRAPAKPASDSGSAQQNAGDQPDVSKSEQAKYVWDLAFDSEGALYIATGGPAAIYRVRTGSPNAKPELFFASDEQHLRCLLFEPDGNLIAGSDGTGLVYRIGKDGKGMVIFDAPKREVTALAESPDGRLYVASVGEKTKSNLPPLPVQGNASVTATITIVAPGSVQASHTNTLIPEGSEVDELSSQGAPRKLWAAHDDVVYALRFTPRGLLAATGNRGRIYRVAEDGTYTDLARASSGQATAFAPAPTGLWVATSNVGRLYRLDDEPTAGGSYESDVFDAGAFSTWGRAEINSTDGGSSGLYDFYARSGNVENPERNWSPWEKVANGARLSVPAARFVQWKAVLQPGARLSAVGIDYLQVNLAPVVDEVAVAPGARVNASSAEQPNPQPVTINLGQGQSDVTVVQNDSSGPLSGYKDRGAVTVRWSAHDDNGDRLVYSLYIRGDGEKDWRLLKSGINQTFYSFNSLQLPDGGYRVKVVASDAPSHPQGKGLTGEQQSDHFVIDTTPPAISSLTAKIEAERLHVTFRATDATSPIARAEYSVDAGPWQYIDPVGQLSDSTSEDYDFTAALKAPASPSANGGQAAPPAAADPGEHLVTVRVYDRYDNAVDAKTVVH
ncbi:MAG TPA: hypothetical protein VHX11_05680 [Acidobacteriaceae bacterium]|jgi:WD40 repeat protein|nr:hypothetical protein [Acidobacteriaceae bacterium]